MVSSMYSCLSLGNVNWWEEHGEFHHNGIREVLAFPLCHYNYSSSDETWDCKFSWIYHSFNLCKWDKVHNLGQKPQAAVGSKRAIRTEENRFTALLSRIGFPAMCFASFVGLLTTMPVFSSKPRVGKKPGEVQNTNDLKKTPFLPQRK